MDRARSGGGVAQADLSGELRMRRSHEGRHLLVPDLNVLHFLFGLFQCDVEAADAVSGISVNALQSPFGQSMPNEFAYVHGSFRSGTGCRCRYRSQRRVYANVASSESLPRASRRRESRWVRAPLHQLAALPLGGRKTLSLYMTALPYPAGLRRVAALDEQSLTKRFYARALSYLGGVH